MSDTQYLYELWNSLEYNELLSMRKSNVFSKEMLRIYKIYMLGRNIRELIPVIAVTAIASIVMETVLKNLKQNGKTIH